MKKSLFCILFLVSHMSFSQKDIPIHDLFLETFEMFKYSSYDFQSKSKPTYLCIDDIPIDFPIDKLGNVSFFTSLSDTLKVKKLHLKYSSFNSVVCHLSIKEGGDVCISCVYGYIELKGKVKQTLEPYIWNSGFINYICGSFTNTYSYNQHYKKWILINTSNYGV